jgi:hypothetical protein
MPQKNNLTSHFDQKLARSSFLGVGKGGQALKKN